MTVYDVMHVFSELLGFAAGGAIGLTALIVGLYWRVYRTVHDGARLLPLHVLGIGVSYGMLAFLAVAVMGDPPPPYSTGNWWVYPWATLAFLIGDASLAIVLRFVARRGPRYRSHHERRA